VVGGDADPPEFLTLDLLEEFLVSPLDVMTAQSKRGRKPEAQARSAARRAGVLPNSPCPPGRDRRGQRGNPNSKDRSGVGSKISKRAVRRLFEQVRRSKSREAGVMSQVLSVLMTV